MVEDSGNSNPAHTLAAGPRENHVQTGTVRDRKFGQAMALFFVCFGLLLTLGLAAQTLYPIPGLVFTLVGLILVPAIAFVAIKGVGIKRGLRIRPVKLPLAFLSLLIGVGTWSVAVKVHELMVWALGQPFPQPGLNAESFSQYLSLVLVIAVLPGICEECLFRGAIQGVLERRGSIFAILVSSILFGLFHLDPWRILPAAFLGMIFGWLVVRTQSIIPAVIAHMANNGTAITTAYVFREAEKLPDWLLPALAIVFLSSLFLMWKFTSIYKPSENENPLAEVPAGLHPVIAWVGGTLVVLGGLAFGSLTYLILSIVTVVEMNDDALLPHIKAGDQLLLIKSGSFAFDLKPGDSVSFDRDGVSVTRVVARVEAEQIAVLEDGEELLVDRADLIGKMIQVIPK